MPKINIFEQDNTGIIVNDLAGVLILGDENLASNDVSLDTNGCLYIPSTVSTNTILDYFGKSSIQKLYTRSSTKINVIHMITNLVSLGYGVVYKYVESSTDPKDIDFSFLKDKNEYNIKFITAGNYGVVQTSMAGSSYTFDFTLANNILPICGERKDCSLLMDLNYSDIIDNISNTDEFMEAYKDSLENESSTFIKSIVINNNLVDLSSRAYSLLPNTKMNYIVDNNTSIKLNVPASYIYLTKFASNNNNSTSWLPIAGVVRGVLDTYFEPDLQISKYSLDTNIISDEPGKISFNGICKIRPYGNIIWGDRTCLYSTKSYQAMGYFSLRNLVSDVAKIAYDTSILYTYESNNDITWMNFKSNINILLDQMVASGVLQSYEISKGTSDSEPNKIVAVIALYPTLPVENFDIYINLENAEVEDSANS